VNHIPIRNCAACRTRLPKKELLRIVRSPEGTVHYDPAGNANGRGLYWCGKRSCLDRIRKKGLVGQLLKAQIPEELFSRLEEVILG
jgi:predicted RNA-binding protein YlxR (DUF448 family)